MKNSANEAGPERPLLNRHRKHPKIPRKTYTRLIYQYIKSVINWAKSYLFQWFHPQRPTTPVPVPVPVPNPTPAPPPKPTPTGAPPTRVSTPIRRFSPKPTQRSIFSSYEPIKILEPAPPKLTPTVPPPTIIDLTISNDNGHKLIAPVFDNYKSDSRYLLSVEEEQTWINKLSQDSDIKVSHAQQLLDMLVASKLSPTQPPLDFRVEDSILNKFFTKLPVQYNNSYSIDSSLILPHLFEKFKTRPKYLGDLKENVNQIQTILWPISNGEPGKPALTDHWFLVIMNKLPNGKYNIYALDGLNSPGRSKYLEKAKEVLKVLHPGKALNELVNEATAINVPTQSNGVDCAVVVCYWALQFLNGCDFKSPPKNVNYTPFRLEMAKIITKETTATKGHQLNWG